MGSWPPTRTVRFRFVAIAFDTSVAPVLIHNGAGFASSLSTGAGTTATLIGFASPLLKPKLPWFYVISFILGLAGFVISAHVMYVILASWHVLCLYVHSSQQHQADDKFERHFFNYCNI